MIAAVDLRDGRSQAADVCLAGEQFERVVDARAGLQQQREVAGEDRHVLGRCGRENSEKSREARPTPRDRSATVSIGMSPRNSMRRAISAAVGAVIEPLTISPLCVSAR